MKRVFVDMEILMHPFLAHLIGDFLIQTEWMAINKKSSSFVAFVHVLAYLVPYVFTSMVWWQIALIGVTHFAQDRSTFVGWWMKNWKKVPGENGSLLALMVDQVFHLVIIQVAIWLGTL